MVTLRTAFTRHIPTRLQRPVLAALFFGWVIVAFEGTGFLARVIVGFLFAHGVDFSAVNESMFTAVSTAIVDTAALVVAIAVPWLLFRDKTTKQDLGLQRLPTWSELGLAPAAFIVYTVVVAVIMYLVSQFAPGIDLEQKQNVGFNFLATSQEYVLAFVTLVIVAPIMEEVIFRGYLYGKLKKYVPWWVAIVLVSAFFGFAHGQWNVAIATFVLSVFLCLLRDMSGSIWASITLHMIKNGIAFYFLFVNQSFILGS